jgi:glucosamine--fructose-6-phosphate aminotransferase (isomerizing)
VKWLGNFPDPFAAEIAGQPAALRRAIERLREGEAALGALAEAMAGATCAVFTGMGSSYDACYPAVNELAARGLLAMHVDSAELLHFRAELLSPSTVLVAVSQSGQSAEIVRITDLLARRDRPPVVLSITNGLENDLARRSGLRLDTGVGTETGPSTMTFAASIAQLAAVASALAGDPPSDAVRRAGAAAEGAAAAIESLLADGEALGERLAGAVRGREVVAVLGRGPARAAAEMGALTLKESGVMAESFATAAFRHGPFELAGPGLAAIVLATERATRALDLRLAADLAEAGSSVVVLAPSGEAPDGALGVPIPPLDPLLGSAVSIVPIQLLSWRLAVEHGRVPGVYTRASKVTVRE